jgi:hypothetical protein
MEPVGGTRVGAGTAIPDVNAPTRHKGKPELPPLRDRIEMVVRAAIASALPDVLESLDDKQLDRLDRAIDRYLKLALSDEEKGKRS